MNKIDYSKMRTIEEILEWMSKHKRNTFNEKEK